MSNGLLCIIAGLLLLILAELARIRRAIAATKETGNEQ